MSSLSIDTRRYRAVVRQLGATRFIDVNRILLLLILVLGMLVRFIDIGLIRHLYDYSYPGYEALRILEEGRLLLTGQPSSVFLDNPPLMSYIQAIPLLLWGAPWAVYAFIIGLNTLALWFVYRVTADLLDRNTALVGTLLFAINPWIIFFSRTTWVQALLPFFVAVITWGLWSLACRQCRQRRFLVTMLMITALTQTYIQAMAIVAQVAATLVPLRRRVPRRALYAGLLIFMAVSVIYGYGLSQNWDHNAAQLEKFANDGGDRQLTGEALGHAIRLVTGRDFFSTHIQTDGQVYDLRRTLSRSAHYLLLTALLGGILRALLAWRRKGPDRQAATLLLLWFVIPIALMSYTAHPVHPHYLLLSCPAGHILAAWGITPLLNWRGMREGGVAALLFLALLFGLNVHAANQVVAASPGGPSFDRWALRDGARVGSVVRDLVDGQQRPVRIVAPGHPALLSSLSGRYLEYPGDLYYPDFIVLPADEPLLYLLVNQEAESRLDAVQERFPSRRVTLADGTTVNFLRTIPQSAEEAIRLPAVPVQWRSEAGLSLLGYTLEGEAHAGAALELVTYWRVDSQPPTDRPIYLGAFYQLIDQAETKVATVDGRGQWSYHWRKGDIYRERVQLHIPEETETGRYQLLIGLFDPIHKRNYYLQAAETSHYALSVPIRVHQPGEQK